MNQCLEKISAACSYFTLLGLLLISVHSYCVLNNLSSLALTPKCDDNDTLITDSETNTLITYLKLVTISGMRLITVLFFFANEAVKFIHSELAISHVNLQYQTSKK